MWLEFKGAHGQYLGQGGGPLSSDLNTIGTPHHSTVDCSFGINIQCICKSALHLRGLGPCLKKETDSLLHPIEGCWPS